MNIPDEALFYIVERDTTISDLTEALYGPCSLATINHILRVNPHLDGDWVRAGQMLIVTPPEVNALAMLEQQMAIAARHVDTELKSLSSRERETLARHYALLSNIASYQIARYGWTTTPFNQHKKSLEAQLGKLNALAERSDTETEHQEVEAGRPPSLQMPMQIQLQIHQSVCGLLSSRLFNQGAKFLVLKAKAGLLRGAEVHQWKTQVGPAKTIASFKTHFSHIIKEAKNIAHTGRLALALDTAAPDCLAKQTHQLALFDFGSLSTPTYRLVISVEAGRPDLLRCSITSASEAEPVFSRCYHKSQPWLAKRLCRRDAFPVMSSMAWRHAEHRSVL